MFALKKLISLLLLPPACYLLLIVLGLVLLKRKPRLGKGLLGLGLITAFLISTPAVVLPMLQILEPAPAIDGRALRASQVIVILGGGRNRYAPEYGGETVSSATLARLRYGALLAKQSGLPILLSGGAPTGGSPEAQLMAKSLTEDFGINPQWIEDQSLDTAENARLSAALISPRRYPRIVLVSDAIHMTRAKQAFELKGFIVTSATTRYLSGSLDPYYPWLPNARTQDAASSALHEQLGRLQQMLLTYMDKP